MDPTKPEVRTISSTELDTKTRHTAPTISDTTIVPEVSVTPGVGVVAVREISEDEHRAKTRQDSEEWRKLLQLAQGGKMLELTCGDYREARLLAQKLTAVRSFYGFTVRIQHRGKALFLRPKVDVTLGGIDLDPDASTP